MLEDFLKIIYIFYMVKYLSFHISSCALKCFVLLQMGSCLTS